MELAFFIEFRISTYPTNGVAIQSIDEFHSCIIYIIQFAILCRVLQGTTEDIIKMDETGTTKRMSAASGPVGVAILSVLIIVVGIFAVFAGITIDFILAGGSLTLVGSFQLGAIVVGLLTVVAGIGLWKLKSWAWWLAVIVIGLGLILNVSIVLIDFTELRFYFLPMLLRAVVLGYLMHKPIRIRFR